MNSVAALVIAIAVLLGVASAADSQVQRQPPPDRGTPPPSFTDVAYGPDERNVLDLWQAASEKPAPLVVFIHAGGFRTGDKRVLPPPLVRRCLERGISVASINYRLSATSTFPAFMLDGARAVQYLRYRAAEWNLDPTRVACCGGSAGAGISLWLAFHDDLADPRSEDLVLRESTRLTAAGSFNGQCSYDPSFIKEHIGGSGELHPALLPFYGLAPEQVGTPEAQALYDRAAPITYLSADDPPVFAFYTYRMTPVPLPPDADPDVVIHHPQFGVVLKQRMAALGITCVLRLPGDYLGAEENIRTPACIEMAGFFATCFALD